jgi:hypothetical protein
LPPLLNDTSSWRRDGSAVIAFDWIRMSNTPAVKIWIRVIGISLAARRFVSGHYAKVIRRRLCGLYPQVKQDILVGNPKPIPLCPKAIIHSRSASFL